MASSGQSAIDALSPAPPPCCRHLLLIEDNAGDVELLTIALEARGLTVRLTLAVDGDVGLDTLQKLIADGDLPDLVLLDLNMPRRSGFEVLAAISVMVPPSSCPLAVWSSSSSAADQARCLASGASTFFTKPENFDDYLVLVDALAALLTQPPPR